MRRNAKRSSSLIKKGNRPNAAGEDVWPRCMLAYAPPDIVAAVRADRNILASPAQDMWALGVMALEAIVHRVTLTTMGDNTDCASGAQAYPWEGEPAAQPPAWRHARAARAVPRARPRAAPGRGAAARGDRADWPCNDDALVSVCMSGTTREEAAIVIRSTFGGFEPCKAGQQRKVCSTAALGTSAR
jgi:hypothetical protein